MKIVHVASEMFPYMKTGGLADAVSALCSALAENGHELSVFLPGYRAALEHPDASGAERKMRLKVEMANDFLSGDVRVFSPRKNLKVYLICREEFFDRRQPYGNGERDYEDNSDRFIFFCKAVVEMLRLGELQADVVHCHDWQAALLPVWLREAERRHGVTLALKTIFTIHNIAYQGVFPSKTFARTNLPDELNQMDGLEYYSQINLMKGGIMFADRVTTVSPRYAKESRPRNLAAAWKAWCRRGRMTSSASSTASTTPCGIPPSIPSSPRAILPSISRERPCAEPNC